MSLWRIQHQSYPIFSTSRLILLENGGIFVMANIRGGGDYGENGTMKANFSKSKMYLTIFAAAEYLIKEKYTSSSKLALQGRFKRRSAWWVHAAKRPDLYRGISAVGVMGHVAIHKFTVGWG